MLVLNQTLTYPPSPQVVNELRLAVETFGLSKKQLKDICISGFKRSFYPGSYKERRAYVRTVMDYYDTLEKRFQVE